MTAPEPPTVRVGQVWERSNGTQFEVREIVTVMFGAPLLRPFARVRGERRAAIGLDQFGRYRLVQDVPA